MSKKEPVLLVSMTGTITRTAINEIFCGLTEAQELIGVLLAYDGLEDIPWGDEHEVRRADLERIVDNLSATIDFLSEMQLTQV
jgi:hypothetical protein